MDFSEKPPRFPHIFFSFSFVFSEKKRIISYFFSLPTGSVNGLTREHTLAVVVHTFLETRCKLKCCCCCFFFLSLLSKSGTLCESGTKTVNTLAMISSVWETKHSQPEMLRSGSVNRSDKAKLQERKTSSTMWMQTSE